ncbi:MAG: hypothetical protein JXB88_02945 [Spirochaetales bacterium]|nr:hypothetical protein [Spirochaetales bacterium]
MMYDYNLAQKAACSNKEKLLLKPLIRHIFNYAIKARREGLLAIEDSLPAEKSHLLQQGLQLVLDGTDPDIVGEILKNKIYSSPGKGPALLAKIIIHSGVCGIQKGYTPLILLRVLASFLGDIEAETINEIESSYKKESMKNFLNNTPGIYRVSILDKIIPGLDDRSIQKMLREVDTSDLARSLIGAGLEIKKAILRNMSKRAAFLLVEDMNYIGPVRKQDVEEAQIKLKIIIKRLVEQGEIPPGITGI